jgi:hypothetical protein
MCESVFCARPPSSVSQILETPSFYPIVRWSPDGDAMQILNVGKFSDRVLPLFFKVRVGANLIRSAMFAAAASAAVSARARG